MAKIQNVGEIVKDYRSIDHRNSNKSNSMDYRSIDSEVIKKDNSSPSQFRQRAIAEKLLDKLGEPKSWKFYLKCAYHLSEEKIWEFVDLAMRPDIEHHNRYFVRIANNEMNK